jgi:tetratricopeptide (TPR) repeat protein
MSRIALLCLSALLIAGMCSCSPRKLAVHEIAGIVETGMTVLEQDNDLDMLAQALPANIKLLEIILASSPEDADLLTLLARSYGSYTFMLIEPKLEDVQFRAASPDADEKLADDAIRLKQTVSEYYLKGMTYALKALEVRHPRCRTKLKTVGAIEPFLQTLSHGDVAAVFWYGFNLAAWINLNLDSVQAISQGHVAEKCMRRVIELQPDFFSGSARLVLIAYYASRSPMMGGNPDAARRHYEALKQTTGESFLMADLFYARYYLQQSQDRQACETMLKAIVAASSQTSAFPLFNKVAENKAHIYLSALGELFE